MRIPIGKEVKKEWTSFRYFPNPKDRRLGTTHLMEKNFLAWPTPDIFVAPEKVNLEQGFTSLEVYTCMTTGCNNWASHTIFTPEQLEYVVSMVVRIHHEFKHREWGERFARQYGATCACGVDLTNGSKHGLSMDIRDHWNSQKDSVLK